ncbi:MAG: thiolase family protein, partial [Rhodobacteraceae bacterium]|nr:thiolase family protein [Paracoccaceae bacterium]
MSSEAFILAACRSPIVPIHGALKNIDIFSLGASVADECIRQSGIQKSDIHELILANVLGPGGNPARSISLKLALNESVAGITIDRQCASGLDALNLAKILIQSGHQ